MCDLSHFRLILVLEDEGLIRLDLEDTLLNAGVAKVVGVATLEEAFAALEQERPDAAVLDVRLGRDRWSFDLARRLRAEGIPFVFSSGSADAPPEFADVAWLMKPFTDEALVGAVRGLVPARETGTCDS